MPTRRTVTRSYRGLFGTRVRYTTSQIIGPSQPNVQVHLTGRDLVEMQRLQAEAATAHQQLVEQTRAQEAAAQTHHLATLNSAARWLHTPLGAIATLVVFVVGWILMFGASTPVIVIGLPIALAIIDWRDFSSFHGAISWNVWRAEGKNGRWWTLAIVLWLYGWLFMPVVYAIQAWRRAGEVKAASHAALDAQIASLEAVVLPRPPAAPTPVIPPPPPPNPIVRNYPTDDEYTKGATNMAAEGWNVTNVIRKSDNTIVATFTHRSAMKSPADQAPGAS